MMFALWFLGLTMCLVLDTDLEHVEKLTGWIASWMNG